jgi:hypothetical protein
LLGVCHIRQTSYTGINKGKTCKKGTRERKRKDLSPKHFPSVRKSSFEKLVMA